MTSEELKEEKERDAFHRFSNRMRNEESWLSVESRKPCEPDLLCQHVDFGFIAFELVRITDEKIAKTISQITLGQLSDSEVGYTRTSDPSRKIKDKLNRKYTTNYPIQLLIYVENVITPDDVIIETVRPIIECLTHPFRKVWFMGEHQTLCIWKCTEEDN